MLALSHSVYSSSQNMDTYARNCTEMKQIIGALIRPEQNSLEQLSNYAPSKSTSAKNQSVNQSQATNAIKSNQKTN